MMIQHNAKRIVELKADHYQPDAASLVLVRRRTARAGNPADFFDKIFTEYQQGFSLNGELLRDVSSWSKYCSGESWLGLDTLHQLTSRKLYKLKITMTDFDGKEYVAVYDRFKVKILLSNAKIDR